VQDASPPGRSAFLASERGRTLLEVLERARALGFLGKGPVAEHAEHALAYADALPSPATGEVVDLGTGGGIPALPLALVWPETSWTLVDRGDRRTAFLQDATRQLGLQDRVQVLTSEAERLAHDPAHRGRYALVTARSFGPPAQLAECAAALLQVGGALLVSEPPVPDADRWPEPSLQALGLSRASVTEHEGTRIARLTKVGETPAKAPRRTIRSWFPSS
jgi:precorrin-6B methylase 2